MTRRFADNTGSRQVGGKSVGALAVLGLAVLLLMPAGVVAATKTTIALGPNVGPLAHDRVAGLTYVGYSGGVAVIDTSSHVVTGTVAGGINDVAVNPTNGTAVVAPNSFPGRIVVIDGATRSTQTIPTRSDQRSVRVAVSTTLGRAFVEAITQSGPQQVHLMAVDLATGATLGNVIIPTAVNELVVDDDTGRLYGPSSAGVAVFDLTTLATLPTIPLAGGSAALAWDPIGHRLYAATGVSSAEVAIIDTTLDTVVETIPVADGILDLDVDPTHDRLFVIGYGALGSPLLVFTSGVLTETISMGTQPRHVAVALATGDAWVTDPIDGNVTVVSPSAATVDANGDGIADTLQPGATPVDSFVDGTTSPVTTGSIIDRGGLPVTIADAAAPADGVVVTTGSGAGPATLSVCGFTVTVDPNSAIQLTCASVRIKAMAGSAKVVLGGGVTVVTIPTGGAAEVGNSPGGAYSVANLGSTPITITVDSTTSTIQPGEPPRTATTWRFVGFSQPIDNLPTVNRANSGEAIPVKFRLLSNAGVPITNLASATLSVTSATCSLGATVDNIEEVTTGASGLQNLGNGNYQLNWKSPKTYAKSCKTLHLDVGDGVLHDAAFEFPK